MDSIHRFSKHPIIVVNFGQQAPVSLLPLLLSTVAADAIGPSCVSGARGTHA